MIKSDTVHRLKRRLSGQPPADVAVRRIGDTLAIHRSRDVKREECCVNGFRNSVAAEERGGWRGAASLLTHRFTRISFESHAPAHDSVRTSRPGLGHTGGYEIHCDEPREGIHPYRPRPGHRGHGHLCRRCGRREPDGRPCGHRHAADGRSGSCSVSGPRGTGCRRGPRAPRWPSASSLPRSRHF